MAIQTINDALPNGDTPRQINQKINENFSNEDHAASKLVGTSSGQIPLAMDIAGVSKQAYRNVNATPRLNLNTLENIQLNINTVFYFHTSYHSGLASIPKKPINGTTATILVYNINSSIYKQELKFLRGDHPDYWRKGTITGGGYEWEDWHYYYGTNNTKLDTNGAIAPSSPTIDLYSDHIETNSDGAKMNPEFVRNGVGDYTIKNTTGLRDEGWYIKIPNDMNGNPKVAVAIDTDKDGNLSIKTYKRTFSMETFTFGPDLSEPLDIPEGRWIDLRFNDLPEEELDEPELVDEEEESEVTEEEPVEEEPKG